MSRSWIVGATADPVGDAGELFRAQRRAMTRLAFLLTGVSAVADEIVQEAFLKVHANWARIDNPVGYLRTTVVNGCRSYHRRRSVERRSPVMSEPVSVAVVDELGDALAKLPYRQRAALALRYYCDLADAEIADALGVRPATVRSLVHRGLAELRKEIER